MLPTGVVAVTAPDGIGVEAAEPLGLPVFPCLPYGMASSFAAYPDTVTLWLRSYLAVIEDMRPARIAPVSTASRS